MGYSRYLLAGFSWQTLLKVVGAGLVMIKLAIIARILTPADFGLFSLGLIALGLTESFTQTGVNLTIINSERSVKYFLDTAWVIAIIRGGVIGILMIGLGAILATYFQDMSLWWLVSVLALVPVIKGFINPAIVGWQKELKFGADSFYRLALVGGEVVFSIGLVAATRSVYGLAVALVLNAVWEVLISLIFVKEWPRFRYLSSRGKEILSQANKLSIAAILNYLNENLDNLVIGKLLGNFDLGLYQNAYALGHKVNLDFAKSWYHGTFPIFSKLQTQPNRLMKAFIKSGGVLVLIMSVGTLPLIIWPQFFIRLILGEQWLLAAGIVRWLVLAGWVQGVANAFYSFLMAKRQVGTINLHLATSVVLMVGLIVLFTQWWGLMGAASAILVSRFLALPILALVYSKQLVGLKTKN